MKRQLHSTALDSGGDTIPHLQTERSGFPFYSSVALVDASQVKTRRHS